MSGTDAPIACTLDGPSYSARLAEIRALSESALRRAERDGLRLHLTFDASARAAVEAMVRKEQACCAFLDFQLAEADGAIKLTITVPPAAAGSADDLFAPFAATADAGSCGCAATPPSRVGGALTTLSLGAGGATLLCGAACGIAVALAAFGVGSAWLTSLNAIQPWWPLTVAVSAFTLAAAWLVRYRLGGSPSQLRALQLATALVLLGAVWGLLETA